MHNFVVRLDPSTREELYSDASEDFVGFLIIEAIANILVAGQPNVLKVLDDEERIQEFPESQIDVSTDYLLEVVQHLDVVAGVVVSDENYQFNSDHHEVVSRKLADAILSVEVANGISEILSLSGVFTDPQMINGFHFNAMHFQDRVVYCLYPNGSGRGSGSDDALNAMIAAHDHSLAIANTNNPPWNWDQPGAISF